jgi:hypothetical protein
MFSSPHLNYSKRHYSNGKPLPKPNGFSFEIPYIVLDTPIVDHIINNHSIASLKQVIDNQIFASAAHAGLLVVGNCYKVEVFIPLTIPGELQMVPLFKYDSCQDHVYFSYNEIVKSSDLSTFIHLKIRGIPTSDKYEFTSHILLFKFTPCYISQNS